MKLIITTATTLLLIISTISAQTKPKAKIDFDAFEQLVKETKQHRKTRLIDLNTFLKFGEEDNTIILDTRSDEMYNRKHIAGALHLNFSDFTQANLANLIPSTATKILIYCNNNFENDQKNFPTKVAAPKSNQKNARPVTLALNIPTYINLFGDGYKNVYELNELVNSNDDRVNYEGTEIETKKITATGQILLARNSRTITHSKSN